MSDTVNSLIALLRSAITESHEEIKLSDVNYEELYSLAKFHDLTHIIYYELNRQHKLGETEVYKKFKKQYDRSLYRYVNRDIAINEIRRVFEKTQVPFVLLKGAVLMDLYPEPWMRNSSDIDVLVKEESLSKAENALISAGMTREQEGRYDVSFFSIEGFHIELHYTMLEDYTSQKVSNVMERAWDYIKQKDENSVECVMSDEMFYFYHMAHMAKHFRNGGNGVRTFIDLWLLNHKIAFSKLKREKLIEEGGLNTFNENSINLSEVWFSHKEDNGSLNDYKEYIINGGIYGTAERNMAIAKKKTNNRVAFYLNRIFLPYDRIKHAFPVLKKHPFLLPIVWVIRWFKLINPAVRKRTVNEIKLERNADLTEGERIETLMKKLEIW